MNNNAKQLYHKDKEEYKSFFPIVRLEDIIETITDKSIQWLFNNYNHIYVEFKESVAETRNKVPNLLRRNGLWITYNTGTELVTEQYIGSNNNVDNYILFTDDACWKRFDDVEVKDGSITLDKLSKEIRNLLGNVDVYNNPDEEDLTTIDNKLKIKDREYDKNTFSGLGHVILRKNIKSQNGKFINVLTQDMIDKPNTIYEIRYDFDLTGEEITIPEECVLDFQGGSLNNGIIVPKGYLTGLPKFINTDIKINPTYDFDNGNKLNTFYNEFIEIEWFGAIGDGFTDDSFAFNAALKCNLPIYLSAKTYYIENKITNDGKYGITILGKHMYNSKIRTSVNGYAIEALQDAYYRNTLKIENVTLINTKYEDITWNEIENKHCIYSECTTILTNVIFSGYDIVFNKNKYIDGDTFVNITARKPKAVTKPNYDKFTDYNFIYNTPTDNIQLINVANLNCSFAVSGSRNHPTINGCIQCGFKIIGQGGILNITNYHNEQPQRYGIYVGYGTKVSIDNGFLYFVDNCLPFIRVLGDLKLKNITGSTWTNYTTKHSGELEHISIENSSATVEIDNVDFLMYGSSKFSYSNQACCIGKYNNDYINFDRNAKFTAKGNLYFRNTKITNTIIYISEILEESSKSTFSKGTYTYKIKSIIDYNRKLSTDFYDKDVEISNSQIVHISVNCNECNSIYIERINNDTKESKYILIFGNRQNSLIQFRDYGDYVYGVGDWKQGNINFINISPELLYLQNELNVNIQGLTSLPSSNNFIDGDIIEVNNKKYIKNKKWTETIGSIANTNYKVFNITHSNALYKITDLQPTGIPESIVLFAQYNDDKGHIHGNNIYQINAIRFESGESSIIVKCINGSNSALSFYKKDNNLFFAINAPENIPCNAIILGKSSPIYDITKSNITEEYQELSVTGGAHNIVPNHYFFQKGESYFNTTLNKPMWWTGEEWVDANGSNKKGTSAQRPTGVNDGFEYYDTTIRQPIYWNESRQSWINADGYVAGVRSGITQRRTELTEYLVGLDTGLQFFDSTLGKTVVWNGAAWVNVDGSALE